ncbi:hypothetical protein N6B72_01115 [Chryseobacterium soli]|uniref:Uncharacterized protein n=2 Tax=Chryseobacterium soli TaxID=445961 RepID=A0A086A3M6_9FLAO|nr:hypothetical protein [Chryseobacterium soli]KFF11290.1 hypothetical protein IW15_16185 [Chryseobacterium soli]MDV7695506.1 hypothetical protein [Chryseobacterium soli]
MRKFISIILLSFYLVSTTELYQLLKIPVLIEHFMEHKEQNAEMTLMSFLKMHYDHPVKDADYQTDQKLPFIVHSSPLTLLFTISPNITFEVKKQIITDHHEKIYSYDEPFYDKDAINSIWQPPKYC